MPAIDLSLLSLKDERDALVDAARIAGEVIKPFFRNKNLDVWQKDDRSTVTEADMKADVALREALLTGPRREYGWLSEESADDFSRFDASRTIIVDPIDGTRAFVRGQDNFTVCLAITEGDKVIASAIYCPMKDEMYDAVAGGGARLNGMSITATTQDRVEGCRMIGQAQMFAHPSWPQTWPEMDIGYVNSTSYRLALVASGQYDATIALARKSDWDVAPGALIAAEADAWIGDHLGRPFTFGQSEAAQPGLVCTARPLSPAVLERLAHLPSDLRTLRP
ncbi:MAG: 3'(2'),5'-bisphosphate nucleotidase CysQ [Pseudomonadota bacterium]